MGDDNMMDLELNEEPTNQPPNVNTERGQGCCSKRDSFDIGNKNCGSFYDCSICLDKAKEPVLALCGHLFCWTCFYKVPYRNSIGKLCPICRGKTSNKTVIPIYGNGCDDQHACDRFGSDLNIPLRPKGLRIESVRKQRLLARAFSRVDVNESLKGMRVAIGAMHNQTQQLKGHSEINSVDPESIHLISSTLSHAEKLLRDLETKIRRDWRQSLSTIGL